MRPGPQRRVLLSLRALLGAVLFVSSLSPATSAQQARVVVERQTYLMGTRAHLSTHAVTRASGLDLLDNLVGILESAEDELSTWRETSLLGRLNQHPVGTPFTAPAWLCALFETLQYWRQETHGAFDPAIGPLVEVWGLRSRGLIPSSSVLATARARSGLRLFDTGFPPCTVTRLGDVTVDAGAFGKGLALDRVAAADLASEQDWLVDLGGQVAVRRATGRPRSVALAHPVTRDRPVIEVSLESGSLAVSGGSERDQTVDAVTIGHILDPRTGRPVSRELSVVVWHQRALVADILSTALYVMGVHEGRAWAETHGIAACFLVPAADVVSGGPQAVELVATRPFIRQFL